MKLKSRLTLLLIIIAYHIGKAQTTDSIEAKANYGSKINDVQLLMDLEHIDVYRVHFKNPNIKKSYLFLTTQEYWNGKVTKADTLLPIEYARENFKFNSEDTVSILSLITKPLKDSVIFNFNFLGVRLNRQYSRIISNDYSLRDGLVTNETFKKIPINKTIPLFVYSLPYEDPKQPGYQFYCALTANGVPPEQWWKKYKIKHFIVVEMKIVTQ
jgi:hypothetical protein